MRISSKLDRRAEMMQIQTGRLSPSGFLYGLCTKEKERIFFKPSKFCARVLLQPLRGSFLPEEACSYTLLL